jgi:hypothetical protein
MNRQNYQTQKTPAWAYGIMIPFAIFTGIASVEVITWLDKIEKHSPQTRNISKPSRTYSRKALPKSQNPLEIEANLDNIYPKDKIRLTSLSKKVEVQLNKGPGFYNQRKVINKKSYVHWFLPPKEIIAEDVNSDGHKDIRIRNSIQEDIYFNDGTGKFPYKPENRFIFTIKSRN